MLMLFMVMDFEGFWMLFITILRKPNNIIYWLFEHGTDINGHDFLPAHGNNSLVYAASFVQVDVAKTVIDAIAYLNSR